MHCFRSIFLASLSTLAACSSEKNDSGVVFTDSRSAGDRVLDDMNNGGEPLPSPIADMPISADNLHQMCYHINYYDGYQSLNLLCLPGEAGACSANEQQNAYEYTSEDACRDDLNVVAGYWESTGSVGGGSGASPGSTPVVEELDHGAQQGEVWEAMNTGGLGYIRITATGVDLCSPSVYPDLVPLDLHVGSDGRRVYLGFLPSGTDPEGSGSQSVIVMQGGTLAWQVEYVEDTSGNYVDATRYWDPGLYASLGVVSTPCD